MRKVLLVLPLLFLAAIGTLFVWSVLFGSKELQSAMIGKPVPDFTLPPVQGRTAGLSSDDLSGEVSLVNVFASWCVPCRQEHPLLTQLAKDKTLTLNGINYKDQPPAAAAWLDELGDPFSRTGADISGRAGIEWGVYGVPETYVVDRDGRILYRHVGPLSQQVLDETILPLVRTHQTEKEQL